MKRRKRPPKTFGAQKRRTHGTGNQAQRARGARSRKNAARTRARRQRKAAPAPPEIGTLSALLRDFGIEAGP